MEKTTTTDTPVPYISNPFSSSFKGFERLFKINQKPAIIILVLTLLANLAQFIPEGKSQPRSASAANSPIDPMAIVAMVLVGIIVLGLILAIGVFVTGIIKYVAYKTSKNEATSISEAFRVTKQKFWTIAWTLILVTLRIWGGLLLLIVPGVRAALRYQMVLYPIFDEGLGASAAINRIKKLTRGHLIEIFGILTVSNILFLVATPMLMGGEAIMYPQLKALDAAGQRGPKAHWLNYIGFVLLALLVILMVGAIVGLIFLIARSRSY